MYPVNATSTNASEGIRQACWRLTLLSVAILPFLAAVGYARSGWMGILAALLASSVCSVGAVGSLLAVAAAGGTVQVVPFILLGTLIRMGLPLITCMALLLAGGPLIAAGAPGMLLVCYLLMLVADTWFSVRLCAARVSNKNVG